MDAQAHIKKILVRAKDLMSDESRASLSRKLHNLETTANIHALNIDLLIAGQIYLISSLNHETRKVQAEIFLQNHKKNNELRGNLREIALQRIEADIFRYAKLLEGA